MPKRVKQGDVFAVQVEDRKVLVQYLDEHYLMGELVKVLEGDYSGDGSDDINRLCEGAARFYAFVPIGYLYRTGHVELVGSYPVDLSEVPNHGLAYYYFDNLSQPYVHVVDLVSPKMERELYYDLPFDLHDGVLFVVMSLGSLVYYIENDWSMLAEYESYMKKYRDSPRGRGEEES